MVPSYQEAILLDPLMTTTNLPSQISTKLFNNQNQVKKNVLFFNLSKLICYKINFKLVFFKCN